MLTSDALHRLLLAGVCLCVCGNAVLEIQKEAAGSLGRRPWRMLTQNRESPDAESEPKKFWRTPRDMMDDVSTLLHEDARWSSTTGALNPSSRTPTPVSLPSRTSTASSPWEREGPVMPAPPEPFFPDMGVDTMPKEDGVESLWTEAPGPSGDTAAPPSPDDTTEGTMSSESLPLIFEPLEESAAQLPAAATASAGAPLSEADPEPQFATETDKPSHAPPPMTPDVEHLDASRQSGFGTVQTSELTDIVRASVVVATNPPVHKPQSGLEETDSEDDPDEDENSEDSPEDEESDEDPTEMSRTEPPYSLIPPPPVWVQRNQGLMRSWVALIREKAGYVSGMMAPVAVGMAGALLLVGALYSVRRIHRRRRNSFKRQRRKIRPAEQPGETCIGRQDQAMLLADSSEDEF
ncbi:armadillo-like helical domain-containing protein 4 isoform X2 [Phyllopteryx taeniolatus]|uniref:armadillo-like helical domain-containing protein 4 isoform X2 n=1 Tax=Phyllopteryx taeniolatus TaxID=161469 RepID=UPI002AD53382|nr:armadillo-like helical domain-containing protein 4 isoform X2 [Phyllopteryx taeniolatus]